MIYQTDFLTCSAKYNYELTGYKNQKPKHPFPEWGEYYWMTEIKVFAEETTGTLKITKNLNKDLKSWISIQTVRLPLEFDEVYLEWLKQPIFQHKPLNMTVLVS